MEQYGQTLKEVCARVNSGSGGLTSAEAAQRLRQNGANAIKSGKKKSKLMLFFAQFKDLMTLILVAAAALSAVLAFLTRDKNELADTGILLFIIFLNAVVGFLQQYRADAALEKLKKLSSSTAKVVRDGKILVVDAETLVVGDVIELAEGDRVPADCRILSSSDFRTDESSLTGESRPVKKRECTVSKPSLAERANTAFMSTFCVHGTARCLVVATGMDTEMGKIAALLKEQKEAPSPLDRTVAKLGKVISATVLAVAAVLFLGGLIAARVSFLQNVMNAVAVAVAAIPEGMGAVVTVILAMGVQRMAKSRAVMRKLSAVQSLGSCSVICSDKTGTLTKNRMTVEEIATDFSKPDERYSNSPLQGRLLMCMRACHTVKGSAGGYVGDPTEVALVEYADRCGARGEFRIVGGTPFSSARKRMSVVAEREGSRRLYAKGGAEILLKCCDKMGTEGGERPLTEADRAAILARCRQMEGRAMRVLAFAEGEGEEERGLTFLGLAAMLDPPKEGVKEAVEACARAGVKTVMITGDSPETAFAIASRLGIAAARSEVITGEEIDAMGAEYAQNAQKYSVYARVSPGHKSQIVKALQERGEVVAMTGDGVNDAPALRAADVGVAMGSGTDVTKSAADMVLTDDDFSTMVKAVEEGRNVFCNIKKTIAFFLATNLAEVLCVLVASLVFWQCGFLTSTQLLWVNLITDSLPVLALGVERTEGTMARPPVSDREIFSKRSLARIAFFALLQTGIVLGVFAYGLARWGQGAASTAAFLALSFCELFHAFNVRSDGAHPKDLVSNRALLCTVAVGVAVNVLLVVVPPLCAAFDLTPLNGVQWAAVSLLSLSVIPVGFLYKAIAERGLKRFGNRTPLRGNAR